MASGKFPFLFLISLIALTCSKESADKCPRILSRKQWQGRQARSENYLITPIPYVIIHHTVTQDCQTFESCSAIVRTIQDYHMDELSWHDIGFSFLVGGDGNVYEGTGWNNEGAHTYGYNKKSIGLAFIGSYQRQNATEKMIEAARKLISCGVSKSKLRPKVKVIGASQVSSTVSPGRKLYLQIQKWPEWSEIP